MSAKIWYNDFIIKILIGGNTNEQGGICGEAPQKFPYPIFGNHQSILCIMSLFCFFLKLSHISEII